MKKRIASETEISKKVADIHEEIQPALYEYNENSDKTKEEPAQNTLKLYYDSMLFVLGKCIKKNNNAVK